MINAKKDRQEMWQTRTQVLENLYRVQNSKSKKLYKSNTNVKENISSSQTTVASTDKNESIILNINENKKHLGSENKDKGETSRKSENSEIINFTMSQSNVYNESNALATTNASKQ